MGLHTQNPSLTTIFKEGNLSYLVGSKQPEMEQDSDEVKSAKILIEEAAHSHGGIHTSLYTF
jgi:hypothetical protein